LSVQQRSLFCCWVQAVFEGLSHIPNNAGNKESFARQIARTLRQILSWNDQETAEYLECCLGRKSDYAHSQTLREGEETSEGRMEQGISLMTAQEIKQMADERIIGFHRQLPPFLETRMDWRHFPVLRERQAIPPPVLSPLPELAESLPTLTPQSNGSLHGYINPDMTAENHAENRK
jgi:type IV secretory pathway TraG/TraD family ATPase VirD4